MKSRKTRSEGSIFSWNDKRGFGFITLESGDRAFVHISEFPPRYARPSLQERVSFTVEQNSDGKLRAHNIRYLTSDSTVAVPPRRGPGTGSYVLIATFVVALAVATFLGALPLWVAGLYVFASIASYMAYATDKAAAQAGQWRVSESILLSLGLLGGWPGSLIAQHRLRHKTQKASFRLAFWGTVALNVLIFAVMSTPLRVRVFELALLVFSPNPG